LIAVKPGLRFGALEVEPGRVARGGGVTFGGLKCAAELGGGVPVGA
jgi:hypothetical protein